jgi:hypothetical protein
VAETGESATMPLQSLESWARNDCELSPAKERCAIMVVAYQKIWNVFLHCTVVCSISTHMQSSRSSARKNTRFNELGFRHRL